eukprot:CAMPEP_0117422498 /NCGR_PEP_ID=MMETSP0758-20121206/3320_1 /TAXON_ID=63605 /ORGANISM="Percolomonas cosmopolitus, Strain AE-1 (ATCC 50343)" /LENGTH=88 /DNA_ID=CAMNT_0005205143 /DNA_START=557 /DNA_END=820 /DNA_ORIENTATION=+
MNGVSDPIYNGNEINAAFQSDLTETIAKGCPNLKYWIYGHTHYSAEIHLPFGCTVCSNQLGYLVMNSMGGYSPSKSIHIGPNISFEND